jgi:hypothetical protein
VPSAAIANRCDPPQLPALHISLIWLCGTFLLFRRLKEEPAGLRHDASASESCGGGASTVLQYCIVRSSPLLSGTGTSVAETMRSVSTNWLWLCEKNSHLINYAVPIGFELTSKVPQSLLLFLLCQASTCLSLTPYTEALAAARFHHLLSAVPLLRPHSLCSQIDVL